MRFRVILVMVIVAAILCSCGSETDSGNSGDENTTSTPEDISVDTTVEESEAPIFNLEPTDYEEYEFRILCKPKVDFYFPYAEVYIEEQNGDTMNDAVYMRNLNVEEALNIKISAVEGNDILTTAKNFIMAGDNEYDLVMCTIVDATSLSLSNLLLDINTIPHFELDSEYWRGSIIEGTSIKNKNYYGISDLNLQSFNTVGAVYFSKNMVENYNLESPYEVVRDGKFTIDYFIETSKGVSKDLNGDNVLSWDDQYGFSGNNFVWQPLFSGASGQFISKDSEDMPVLDLYSEKNIDILSKVITLLNDPEITLFSEQYNSVIKDGRAMLPQVALKEGRTLYWIELTYGIPGLRETEFDFGLLPMPKYDEKQEEYHTYIHQNHGTVLSFPATLTETERTGKIIEFLSYESYNTVRPAFFDVTLKGKTTRDLESNEMLDILYKNIRIDLALSLNVGVDGDIRNMCNKNDINFTSQFSSKENAYNQNLQKIVDIK